jgi:hypothetical protein
MSDNRNKKPATVELFNLVADIEEQENLTQKHPSKVISLTERMRELDAAISQDIRVRGKINY